MKLHCFLFSSVVYGAAALLSIAQGGAPTRATATQAREYAAANQHKIVRELTDLLAIPNFANDLPNITRNAEKLKAMLEARGVRVRFLPIEGRGPVVYGELPAPGATRTVIFYCHYDGQPTDPARWTGSKPFEPALRTAALEAGGQLIPFPQPGTPYQDEWRIYARSASDDKSPIVAILAALDALRAAKMAPSINVKFLLDGEEEAGSPSLERVLAEHRDLLKADAMLMADGPVHQSGRRQLTFGNRGVVGFDITVYGPARPLHSGHYGNWAPNPGMMLAQLLASMKDADGRVLIAGFYDDVVAFTGTEKRALDEMPHNDADLMRELQLARTEGGGRKLVELLSLPSLNIRGIRSGFVGAQSQNIISTQAEASIDCRLVKNVTPERTFERLVAHIRKQGYHVVNREPTREERLQHPRIARVTSEGGYVAARTPMDLPVAQAVVRAVEGALGAVVKMPTTGGSAPMFIFERISLPVIGVPMVNHDNKQHSEDENLRLGNLWSGIELYAVLLADLKW
jgi:acetylornithine deacetylase/succinyl-diaminopimelate desuccinylase-like protein